MIENLIQSGKYKNRANPQGRKMTMDLQALIGTQIVNRQSYENNFVIYNVIRRV